MSVSLLVGLLPYWILVNIGTSSLREDISLWNFQVIFPGCSYTSSEWDILLNFLEAFLGCLYTCSKWFWNSCMSVSLLVGLLPYWNYTNIGISPVLDDIFFWIVFNIPRMFVHLFQMILNFMHVCQSFWNFLETFLGQIYTSSK